jgi:hypothetical protein
VDRKGADRIGLRGTEGGVAGQAPAASAARGFAVGQGGSGLADPGQTGVRTGLLEAVAEVDRQRQRGLMVPAGDRRAAHREQVRAEPVERARRDGGLAGLVERSGAPVRGASASWELGGPPELAEPVLRPCRFSSCGLAGTGRR